MILGYHTARHSSRAQLGKAWLHFKHQKKYLPGNEVSNQRSDHDQISDLIFRSCRSASSLSFTAELTPLPATPPAAAAGGRAVARRGPGGAAYQPIRSGGRPPMGDPRPIRRGLHQLSLPSTPSITINSMAQSGTPKTRAGNSQNWKRGKPKTRTTKTSAFSFLPHRSKFCSVFFGFQRVHLRSDG